MIFKRRDLLSVEGIPQSIDEQLEFDVSTLESVVLRQLKNVEVSGQLTYDGQDDRAYVGLLISGDMTLPDSVTNEDVVYHFETDVSETYSFIPVSEDEPDILVIKNEIIDLKSLIFTSILAEIPLRVVKEGKRDYPKGDGWEVLSEEEYLKQEKPIDPRLEKLKEFKFEK